MPHIVRGSKGAFHRRDVRFEAPEDAPRAPRDQRMTYYDTNKHRAFPRGNRTPRLVPKETWYQKQQEAARQRRQLRAAILSIPPEAVEQLAHCPLESAMRREIHIHLQKLMQALDKNTTRTPKTQQKRNRDTVRDNSAKCQVGSFVKGPVPELLGNMALSKHCPNRVKTPHGDIFCESRPQLVLHRMADRCITLVGGSRSGNGIDPGRLDDCVRILQGGIQVQSIPGERGPVFLSGGQLTSKTFVEAKFNVLFYKEKITSYGGVLLNDGARVIIDLVRDNVKSWLESFADKHGIDLNSRTPALDAHRRTGTSNGDGGTGSPKKRTQSEAGIADMWRGGSPKKRNPGPRTIDDPVPRSADDGPLPDGQYPLSNGFSNMVESLRQGDGEATSLPKAGSLQVGEEGFSADVKRDDGPQYDHVWAEQDPERTSHVKPGLVTQAANVMGQLDLDRPPPVEPDAPEGEDGA